MNFLHRVIMLGLLTLGFVLPQVLRAPPDLTDQGCPIPVSRFHGSAPVLAVVTDWRGSIGTTSFLHRSILLPTRSTSLGPVIVFRLPIHQSFSDSPTGRCTANTRSMSCSRIGPTSGSDRRFRVFERIGGRKRLYRYVDGSQETREVDPGDELVFGDRPFKKHSFGLGLDYWITARDGVRVEGDYDDVAYEDPLVPPPEDPDETGFYDYTRTTFGAGWLHQLNSVLVMDVSYGRINFEPVDTFAWRTSTSDQLTFGLKGQLSHGLSTELRVGWRQTQYGTVRRRAGRRGLFQVDRQGFINWDLGHGSTVRLKLRRSDLPIELRAQPLLHRYRRGS